MSTHPISAGHGYTYLTSPDDGAGRVGRRCRAARRVLLRARRGAGPVDRARARRAGHRARAGACSEEQMTALFGEGRHPNATAIAAQLRAEGQGEDVVALATELGRPFALNLANNEYRRQLAQLAAEWNRAHGQPAARRCRSTIASSDPDGGRRRDVRCGARPRGGRAGAVDVRRAAISRRLACGGRVRPDVLAGQERVRAVGARARGGEGPDRAGAPSGGRATRWTGSSGRRRTRGSAATASARSRRAG